MQENKFKKLNGVQLAYLAGFLEGSGCFLVQIVPGNYYKYKNTIKMSIVFYQRKDKHWFLLQLRNLIGVGVIRSRSDGMLEYLITGLNLVGKFLEMLFPYLILKKTLAILIFRIIKELNAVKNEANFLEVCKLVDKIADHTYSKKRRNTFLTVKNTLLLPVETEE